MKRLLLVLLTGLSIAGCKSGGSSAAGCGSKDFFSQWTANDGSHYLDFTGGVFNSTYATSFNFGGGVACNFDVTGSGAQCGGSIVVANSTHNGIGADPGCNTFNGTYTFGKNANGLSICDSGGCTDYQ